MMEAVYDADKLTETGFVARWDKASFESYRGTPYGTYLISGCQSMTLDGDDRITHLRIQSSAEGVQKLEV